MKIQPAERQSPSTAPIWQLVVSLLVVVGFFGPWIPHQTAALTVTGYELSEFAKFFPQVQGGAVPITRALFITPLLAAGVAVGVLVHRRGVSSLLRLVGTGWGLLLAALALPPLQFALDPPYRLQLILVMAGALLILLTTTLGHLSRRVRGGLLTVTALVGLVPALWQALLLRPLVVGLYDARIAPGWGVLICWGGLAMLALIGIHKAGFS
jgi:hypothetical protein